MSIKNDSLGNRMKEYEYIPRIFLTRKIPVIIRIDGKAFHTFTKGMKKPFDRVLMSTMQETMKNLCENVQGCVFGYTQSDEITLVLTDYETDTTDAWFGYNVQKMASVSASIATLAFNKYFQKNVDVYRLKQWDGVSSYKEGTDLGYINLLIEKVARGVMFDSRVFSIPKEEVCNCLIWRQQDAVRNSIQSVGQANFSQKELHGMSCNQIQDMLFKEKGINWNDFPTDCKRGSCCYKHQVEREIELPKTKKKVTVHRNEWFIDENIPIFTQDRNYVERWL